MSKIVLFCICISVVTLDDAHAKGWRGLVPLHSTCADVKRILGVARCENVNKLEGETVNISYSEKPCVDGWNVPGGTVIDIQVIPKRKSTLTDLNLDMNKYQKVVVIPPHRHDQLGTTHYVNAEEGVDLEIWDGKVESITYFHTAKDSHLRYPNSLADQITAGSANNSTSFAQFDGYGRLPVNEENKRLGDFARQLRSNPNQMGFIVAYGGRRNRVGEAQARAARAKNYLVDALNIQNERIAIMNGGYREELSIDLFVGPIEKGSPGLSPTVCPSEVQIIKGRKMRRSKRRRVSVFQLISVCTKSWA